MDIGLRRSNRKTQKRSSQNKYTDDDFELYGAVTGVPGLDEPAVPLSPTAEAESALIGLAPQQTYPSPSYESESGDVPILNLEGMSMPRSRTSRHNSSESGDMLFSVNFDDLIDKDRSPDDVPMKEFLDEIFNENNPNDSKDDIVGLTSVDQDLISHLNCNSNSWLEAPDKNNNDDENDDSQYFPHESSISGSSDSGRDDINIVDLYSEDEDNNCKPPPKTRVATRWGGKTMPQINNPKTVVIVPHKKQNPVVKSIVKSSPVCRTAQSRASKVKINLQEEIELEDVDKSQRNAIQARINRQKKKAYIQGLEGQVSDLSKENGGLHVTSKQLRKENNRLLEEVSYLKNVIANQSMLSGMLANIDNVSGVRLSTSFASERKRSASSVADHDYGKPSKRSRVEKNSTSSSGTTGGICLHVDNGSVSLEFCSKCAKMACGAGRSECVDGQ